MTRWRRAAVVLTAKQEPGRVAVDELTMEAFGTRVQAKGAVEASGAWGRVTAEVEAGGGRRADRCGARWASVPCR